MKKMVDKEIIFIHTSDWHLGYEQYQKINRSKDFTLAVVNLKKAILSMEPKPNFLIHTGDVFHHFRPSALAFRTAYNFFNAMKENNIDVYVIRGNHDAPGSRYRKAHKDYLFLLSEMGLINYLTTDSPVINLDNEISIMGIGFFGKRTSPILNTIFNKYKEELPKDNLKILLTHALVEGQLPNDYDLTIQELVSYKFDYYALGHYHLPWFREKWNLWVSGSTEQTASNQWFDEYNIRNEGNICKYGSYLVVKAKRNEEENNWLLRAEYKKIPVRWKIIVRKELKGKTATEIETQIREIISQTPIDQNICHFNFKIHGSADQFSEVTNQNKYADLLSKAFHFSIKFDFTQETDYSFASLHATEEEIITNYVKEMIEEEKESTILSIINYFLALGENLVEGVANIPNEEEQLQQILNLALNSNLENNIDEKTITSQPFEEAKEVFLKNNKIISKPIKSKKQKSKGNTSIDEFL